MAEQNQIIHSGGIFTKDDFRSILEKEREFINKDINQPKVFPDYSCNLVLKMYQIKESDPNQKWPVSCIERSEYLKTRWNLFGAWVGAGRYIHGPFLGDLLDNIEKNQEIFEWCWDTLKQNADKGIFDDISKLNSNKTFVEIKNKK